jgi:dTDP-glucose 4,6-dehydratase
VRRAVASDPGTQTIIITGGAGFIGCNLVRLALERSNWRVVVVDALTYAGHEANLAELASHARYAFVRADIADGAAMARLLAAERPKAILNLAAETHVDRSIDGPRAFVRTNVLGTFELLEAARHHWVGLSGEARDGFRLLHVSTDEVYGSLGQTGLFSEDTPYAPSSPYSATKAGADHLVRSYFATFGLPTLITNCSNNYGPYQFPEKLIPLMVLSAVSGRELPIYGDGGNVRDWIYVEDHCSGILRVLEDGRPGENYNIGSSSERTNLQVVQGICGALERLRPAASNARLRERDVTSYRALMRFVPDRPGHDRRYAIDATKCRQELGWRPQSDFDTALEKTVGWYLENQAWCETVTRDYRGERLGLGSGSV